MAGEEMKQDTTITLNWLRVNVPSIVSIVLAGLYIGSWQTGTDKSVAQNSKEIAEIQGRLSTMENLPYRMGQVEEGLRSTNVKIDNLSNTIINQMDLIRRDVNRLTTGVEVLSSRVGLLAGDIDEPKRRRARPGPAESTVE